MDLKATEGGDILVLSSASAVKTLPALAHDHIRRAGRPARPFPESVRGPLTRDAR